MFTYYGDHGFGDTARIPLGYNKEIKQIDSTTIISIKQKTYFVNKFHKQNELVFIQTQSHPYSKEVDIFLIWNLKTNQYQTFQSLETLTKSYSIDTNDFKTFGDNYSLYWHGWRFWLLP